MRIVCIIAVALLAGCKSTPESRPVPPPVVVNVPVEVYVPIPDSLTAPCPIAEGKLSEVVEVARKRRTALEACNAQLRAIRGVQGRPRP